MLVPRSTTAMTPHAPDDAMACTTSVQGDGYFGLEIRSKHAELQQDRQSYSRTEAAPTGISGLHPEGLTGSDLAACSSVSSSSWNVALSAAVMSPSQRPFRALLKQGKASLSRCCAAAISPIPSNRQVKTKP